MLTSPAHAKRRHSLNSSGHVFLKFLRFQVCPNNLANAIFFYIQSRCFVSLPTNIGTFIKNPFHTSTFIIKRHLPSCQSEFVKKATIYNSGPPRNSSPKKFLRFAFKAVLRCMGGDISAVVASASRRPRTFGVLSEGR